MTARPELVAALLADGWVWRKPWRETTLCRAGDGWTVRVTRRWKVVLTHRATGSVMELHWTMSDEDVFGAIGRLCASDLFGDAS